MIYFICYAPGTHYILRSYISVMNFCITIRSRLIKFIHTTSISLVYSKHIIYSLIHIHISWPPTLYLFLTPSREYMANSCAIHPPLDFNLIHKSKIPKFISIMLALLYRLELCYFFFGSISLCHKEKKNNESEKQTYVNVCCLYFYLYTIYIYVYIGKYSSEHTHCCFIIITNAQGLLTKYMCCACVTIKHI